MSLGADASRCTPGDSGSFSLSDEIKGELWGDSGEFVRVRRVRMERGMSAFFRVGLRDIADALSFSKVNVSVSGSHWRKHSVSSSRRSL